MVVLFGVPEDLALLGSLVRGLTNSHLGGTFADDSTSLAKGAIFIGVCSDGRATRGGGAIGSLGKVVDVLP